MPRDDERSDLSPCKKIEYWIFSVTNVIQFQGVECSGVLHADPIQTAHASVVYVPADWVASII